MVDYTIALDSDLGLLRSSGAGVTRTEVEGIRRQPDMNQFAESKAWDMRLSCHRAKAGTSETESL